LEPLDDHFQKLARAPGQGVHARWIGRARNHGRKNIFAAQGHFQIGERNRMQQFVVVDLAEARAAILIARKISVILNAKTSDLVRALFYVGNRIDIEVIHDVARVVIYFHAIIGHLAQKSNLSKKQVVELMDQLLSLATKEAKNVFVVPGFGRLVLANRKARMGRNPQTGEPIKIPAKRVVKFRLSKSLKDTVLGKK